LNDEIVIAIELYKCQCRLRAVVVQKLFGFVDKTTEVCQNAPSVLASSKHITWLVETHMAL